LPIGRRLPACPTRLQQSEIYFDVRGDYDRLSVFQAGLEPPLGYGFNGLFIQAQTDSLHDLQILRVTGLVDFDVKHHRARIFGLAALFGVFRIDLVEHGRGGNSPADAVHAATHTATFTRSESGAFTRSDSAAGTRSNSAAGT